MYINKIAAVFDTLHFDEQLRVHAKCTDIYVYLSRYRYERQLENYLLLASLRAHLSPSSFLALFLLSSRDLAARS